jgi:hypothetical protein
LIREKKIEIVRAKESLGPWVAYPSADKPQKQIRCHGHKVERRTSSDSENFGAEMSFSARSATPCTQMAKGTAGWYMRLSASIRDVTDKGGIPRELPRTHRDGNQR